ncbi:hypothetical protein D3C86_1556160 [compost metagenome]
MLGGVTGPGDAVLGQQNLDLRRRARLTKDDVVAFVRQPAPDKGRVVHGRRQADAAQMGRKASQTSQAERQKVAAL